MKISHSLGLLLLAVLIIGCSSPPTPKPSSCADIQGTCLEVTFLED